MSGIRPLVHAKIDGVDALFVADSGAFFSILTPAAAAEFKLRLEPAPNIFLQGVGGEARAWVTRVKMFTIFDHPIPNVEFLVAGNDLGEGAVGLLGQNVFRIADVEYDLANGAIRLIRAHDCKGTGLAYWANAASKYYSVIDIESATPSEPHTTGVAYLNGKKIRVLFDTGAATSMLTLDAAKRAGVTPASAGVVAGGAHSGIGRRIVRTWIAPFESFKIGDEEIRNARLRIGESGLPNVDMLVGADFFLSHRIYVASSQRKLYFTYNGGPVFNLAPAPAPAAAQGPGNPQSASADVPGDEPADAAGFARRGAASTARRDYEHAIADLTRACELAPTEASYFYERGRAHWGNKQPDLARADFDEAIRLKPDDVPSLIARAELRTARRDPAEAVIVDLDAADHAAPKEAELRIRMGNLYGYAGRSAAAVVQYTKWIDSHQPDDVRMGEAMNSRCWVRAQWGEELDQALADCNAALRLRPDTPQYLNSRGLVYLRRNNYARAIADYDAALRQQPKLAWSLYGRGLAKLRQGQSAEANADLAAAKALKPDIAEQASKQGIGP